jgi:hypothetical protein
MIVKTRVEAEAETMLELLQDLEAVKEAAQHSDTLAMLTVDDEHYERVNENGRPAYFKARLVLIKEQTHG